MKSKVYLLVSMVMLLSLCLAGCKGTAEPEVVANMANPASVYCEENGGSLDIRTDEDGGQYGVCLFEDGSECEEWSYYRGECSPDAQEITEGEAEAAEPVANMANPASVYCEENGGTLDIRTDEDGGQYGVCMFEDGSECEEWEYYRGECGPDSQENETADPETGFTTGIANPASVYCEENGGALDIRSNADGSQYGVCMFADGSQCEEWAYFNGECEPDTVIEGESVVAWQGVIKANPAGAQFDDYFENEDGEKFGIDSRIEPLAQHIINLRDSDTPVMIWGVMLTDAIDVNGTHIMVTRIETMAQVDVAEAFEDDVAGWTGYIVATGDMAQYDDYFQLVDESGRDRNTYGIWAEGELGTQIESLQDTGTIIKIWGTVSYNVPDYNNVQIKVAQLEIQ